MEGKELNKFQNVIFKQNVSDLSEHQLQHRVAMYEVRNIENTACNRRHHVLLKSLWTTMSLQLVNRRVRTPTIFL